MENSFSHIRPKILVLFESKITNMATIAIEVFDIYSKKNILKTFSNCIIMENGLYKKRMKKGFLYF